MGSRRAAAVAACAAVLALASGCADPPPPLSQGPPGAAPADGLARVVALAAERAVLADRVAAAGFSAPGPVVDPAREAAVLAGARADAARAGVDPEWVARVVADQLAAAAGVRDERVRGWTGRPGTRPSGSTDLARVRAELDRIDDELVAALGTAAPARAHEDCPAGLARSAVAVARPLDDVHKAALGRALRSVCDGAPA